MERGVSILIFGHRPVKVFLPAQLALAEIVLDFQDASGHSELLILNSGISHERVMKFLQHLMSVQLGNVGTVESEFL